MKLSLLRHSICALLAFSVLHGAPVYGQSTRATNKRSSDNSKQATGWQQWRGPNRDGVSNEKGLMDSWPESGPAVLWKATELGGGYSSVVVQGDRLFTMGKFGDQTHLIAVSRTDGIKLWSTLSVMAAILRTAHRLSMAIWCMGCPSRVTCFAQSRIPAKLFGRRASLEILAER